MRYHWHSFDYICRSLTRYLPQNYVQTITKLGAHSKEVFTQQPRIWFQASQKNFRGNITDVAEVIQRRWLEESGQWFENVVWTHLVLAGGKPEVKKQLPGRQEGCRCRRRPRRSSWPVPRSGPEGAWSRSGSCSSPADFEKLPSDWLKFHFRLYFTVSHKVAWN